MNVIAAWWAWLGRVEIIIRWPKSEREDWTSEARGAVRW